MSKISSEILDADPVSPELLAIMKKQGALGIFQPWDYEDAKRYRDGVRTFCEQDVVEGSAIELFDDIIFDFDGVLFDGMYPVNKAIELMVKAKGDKNIPDSLTVTGDDVAVAFQSPFQNFYRRFGIFLDTKDDIEAFKRTYREIQKKINAEHHAPAALFPEVHDVLETLKRAKSSHPHLRIHIISAGSETHIRHILTEGGIVQDFDQIHAECHDKVAMIDGIAQQSNERTRTVMIGDLPSDVKDGQRVSGVKTIAIARNARAKDWLEMYLPDYIVEDLNGLFTLQSFAKILKQRTSL
jgi:phosphoglycolate phosphatase-like HAD superfamily hydrolase